VKRAAGVAAGLGAAGVLAVAMSMPGASRTGPAAAAPAHTLPDRREPQPDASRAAASAPLSIEAVGAAIAGSSLRGSAADGEWGIDAAGRFHPTREVRRRFDYYLALQGELPLDALQRWMAAQVGERHGAAAAAQVMPVFASYLRLQQHAWRTEADPQRPQTLAPALAERQQVRRALLGIEVAEAFYRDDDAALNALIAQANSGAAAAAKAAPADGVEASDLRQPLPDAPARLAQWQAEWDDWERRLTAARAELARLRTAPELSAPQRDATIDTWIDQHFDAAEQRRARALLQLPPS
jgi:lipase chaperone LimK